MKPKTLAIAIGILAFIVIGFIFFRLPQPIIELKPELIFSIGPLDVTNTILTGWIMVILIAGGLFLGTRKVSLIPRGFQNVFEAVMDGFGNIVNSVAGEKNGRRFFPVVFALLLYIMLCNWAALTPLFNVIGKTENIGEEVFHEAQVAPEGHPHAAHALNAHIMEKAAGISVIPLFKTTPLIKVPVSDEMTNIDVARSMDSQLRSKLDVHEEPAAECATAREYRAECFPGWEHVEEHGQIVGFVAPYLRGVNTDINSPLSYALWSLIFVEFWGVTALGVLGYGGKFLNFKGGPIGFFVGILEFVSELSRIISFTFRLFGNILAGEVLLFIMSFLAPFLIVDVFYGLELFVGLIQAFVFAMLTLVFGVMAVTSHHGDDHGEHADEHHGTGEAHTATAHAGHA